MQQVSAYLRRLRDETGWTQEEAARRAEISSKSVSDWELSNAVPGADNLARLIDVLGGAPEDIHALFTERVLDGKALAESRLRGGPPMPPRVQPNVIDRLKKEVISLFDQAENDATIQPKNPDAS